MTSTESLLADAMAGGMDYILDRQADDGSWTDWALPPGSSSPWVTAYMGYKLRPLPPVLARRAAPCLAAAAGWLNEHASPEGGWGYNPAVGEDADSTALAILFLVSAGRAVSPAAYATLAAHQCTDGGFATYAPGATHSWHVSHPDVSPVALLALLTDPAVDGERLRRGMAYVVREKTADGLWNSFWWSSCLYSTEANLSLLAATGSPMPTSSRAGRIHAGNPFERALLASCLLYLHPEEAAGETLDLLATLCGEQRPDGSWNSAPVLRVTKGDCYQPWSSEDGGVLYEDTHRLFTTATVLHALARAQNRARITRARRPPAPARLRRR